MKYAPQMRGVDTVGREIDREMLVAQRARDVGPEIAVVFGKQDTHRLLLVRGLKPKLNDPVQRG